MKLCASSLLFFLTAALPPGAAGGEHSPLLTGEVFSRRAQDIFVPFTTSWRSNISMLAPEGKRVNPGDIVVEFDGTQAAQQLEQHVEKTRAEAAKTERDLAKLEKELAQASFAVDLAEVSLELATMKAEIPEGLIGALEHSENQLARERAEKALIDARKQEADKALGLQARRREAELDLRKTELTEAWWKEVLGTLKVKAVQSGYVIHANHPWTGVKFQEGDNVRTSYRVAEVADTSDLAIQVWVNSVDRPHIETGASVAITLDALPGVTMAGRLEAISDSASKRPEWGKGVYYESTVSIDWSAVSGLLPGMSALVEIRR